MRSTPLRVLWVHHSAVVDEWRRGRVEALAHVGVEVTAVSAHHWNEGGADVVFAPHPGEQVSGVRTFGSHPFLFGWDPGPLRRLLGSGDFDVVDFHEEPASVSLFELLALHDAVGDSAPVVCYSAQNIFKRYPYPFRWFERRALARVAGVHSCNDAVETVVRAKGFTGEVANIGLGVDTARFAPVVQASRDGPFRIGFVGRIEERKGIFGLLAAIEATERAEAVFVGAGPDAERLDAAIAARRLGGRVRVQGFVGHDELPELYRSFDVVVVPSLDTPTWSEQFGRVVVEAMASGVPVIVSDAGALAEVAAGACVVVPEGDARALAEALCALRDSPERRAELTAAGLSRATHFSWANIAKRQSAFYDRVCSR